MIRNNVNNHLGTLPDPGMLSPCSSSAMRPSSPLSPGYTGYKTASHFDSLRTPTPRTMHHSRPTSSNKRRVSANSLKLPTLPRFHPANFPSSSHSSLQGTPDGMHSPPMPSMPPISPRAYSHRNDLKRQLYLSQQRELMSAPLRASSPTSAGKPVSPRLAPLGSPGGPVTPLELEGEDGYLIAGARHATSDDHLAPDDLLAQIVAEEVQRQQQMQQMQYQQYQQYSSQYSQPYAQPYAQHYNAAQYTSGAGRGRTTAEQYVRHEA